MPAPAALEKPRAAIEPRFMVELPEERWGEDGRKLLFTALLSLLTGLLLALLSVLITEQDWAAIPAAFEEHALAVFACALLLGLMTASLAMLTRSVFAAGAVTTVLTLAASFVNYFKFLITSTPLQITDVVLLGKAGNIAALNSKAIKLSDISIWALCIAVAALILLLALSKRLRPGARAVPAAVVPISLFLLLFAAAPIADAWCFSPLSVPSAESFTQAYINQQCGVPLGLWRSVLGLGEGAVLEDVPREEIIAQAQAMADSVPVGGGETKPNVIMVLSESFFDVTELPGVTYEQDPLADFHRLSAEGVSGKFYTRTVGYGTCDIELQMLTGINNRFLALDDMLCNWPGEAFDKLPAVPEIFAENGYYTAFMHTFNDAIYDRTPRYTHLGFDDLYFSGDFSDVDPKALAAWEYWTYLQEKVKGGAYSDDYMGELIIDLFERERGENPVFLYAVTMENHTPFPADKFDTYDFPFTADISAEAAGALDALTQGTADSSAMLGKLAEYFSTVEEPTVIIFFGDHRPGLPLQDGGTLYSELGVSDENAARWTLEETGEMYSTDYVIWANDPALLPDAPGSRRDTSCFYLGLDALRLADMPLDPYWRVIASLRESFPAYAWHYLINGEGELLSSPNELSAEDKRRLDIMTWMMRETFSDGSGVPFNELK